MNNEFINVAKPINLLDFKNLEKEIDGIFPEDFKDHYLKFNGGFPVKDRFYIDDYDTYTSINGFIPVKYHYENNDNWTLEETFNHFNKKGYLPNNLIAFASDYGGNKFCIDLESGKIFIVYMDLGNPMENQDAIRQISDNFNYFINNLEEEDEDEDV